MKILLVEDELDFASEVIAEIEGLIGRNSVDLATNKEDAISRIDASFYDLIVLDLKIPASAGELDIDTTHGHAVFGHCRSFAEGTPVCFLTASSTEAFVTRLLNNYSSQGDYWGENSGEVGIRVIKKNHLSEALDYIAACNKKVQALHAIEVKSSGDDELSTEALRILRLYTKRMGGVACDYSSLKGGLSKIQVYKALVENNAGKYINMAVARIGSCSALQDESRRFDSIVGALGVGTFPSRLISVDCGAKSTGGIFYRLADKHGKSLFDFTMHADETPSRIVSNLKDALKPWKDGSHTTRLPISDLRRCLLRDEEAVRVSGEYGLTWCQEIESIVISVAWGSMHGDLHGGNILVSENYNPVVIDFGDTDEGGIALDPITLFLSPFFHPDLAMKIIDHVSHEQLLQMVDSLKGSTEFPLPSYFSECISWIKEYCNNSSKTIYASFYCYALRQLKYPTTDKDLALAILNISRDKILATIS